MRDKEDIGEECNQCHWDEWCMKKPIETATQTTLCKYFVSRNAKQDSKDMSLDGLISDGYVKGGES